MKKGIIFLHNGLGDVIMALPVLQAIQEHAKKVPGKWIVYVGNLTAYNLLQSLGYENYFKLKQWHGHLINYLEVIGAFPEYFLAPHSSGDWRMSSLSLFSGAKKRSGTVVGRVSRIGFNMGIPSYFTLRMHKVLHYLKVVSAVGLKIPSEPEIKIDVLESWVNSAAARFPELKQQKRWLLCAPGSSELERHKRWRLDGYVAIAKRFQSEMDGGVIWTGAPDEVGMLEELHQEVALNGCSIVSAESDIKCVMGLFSYASVMLAPCNGASHLGAAVGLPLVGLYGPTNPANTSPYSPLAHRVSDDKMSCSPCYAKEFRHGCGNPLCMTNISTQAVWETILLALDGSCVEKLVWKDASPLRAPTWKSE